MLYLINKFITICKKFNPPFNMKIIQLKHCVHNNNTKKVEISFSFLFLFLIILSLRNKNFNFEYLI